MNLKDLSQIDIKDLKNIDLGRIKDTVRSSPGMLVNIVLIIISLVIVIQFFIKNNTKTKQLKYEIVALNEKLGIVKEHSEIKKNIDDFVEQFPKTINDDLAISKISDLASAHNIQILSFSPAQRAIAEYYEQSNITFTVSTNDYAHITHFIEEIEKLPFAVRINSWAGKLSPTSASPNKTNTENPVEVKIEISLLRLKT